MQLEGKTAVVYGGGGLIGGAVARAFAREGARVIVAGRTPGSLEAVAGEIGASWAQVDALDERAVEEHLAAVGRVDVSFNAIGIRGELQGTPLVDMPLEDYFAPIAAGTRTHFITARAAARRMVSQGSGAILLLTATSTFLHAALRTPIPMGGFGVACAAIEGLARTLAGELGPRGVRVVCLRSEGVAEVDHGFAEPGDLNDLLAAETLLRRLPSVAELADVAAFLASDHASAITGAITNVSSGAVVD